MKDAQVKKLVFEVRALEQNPIFQEYLKIVKILNEGEGIKEAIDGKMKLVRSLQERQEPYSHLNQAQGMRTKPVQRQASSDMQREARQRPPMNSQREQEIDRRVAMSEADEATQAQNQPLLDDELNREDDLELPDIDLDDNNA